MVRLPRSLPAPALPLAAGVVAMLVAMPVSVAWGALARGWFGLPEDYEPANPAFLIAASAAVSSLVAVAFALTVRSRAPRAVGASAAVLLLAMVVPALLAWQARTYPHEAGPAVGAVTHVLVGGVGILVVLRALRESGPAEEDARGQAP